MDIKINPAAMKDIVAHAILQQMTEVQRDTLIQAAIANLLEPGKPDQWNRNGKPSPLEEAFGDAIRSCARGVCQEYVERPEVKGQIEEALRKSIPALLEKFNASEYLADALADAIRKSV